MSVETGAPELASEVRGRLGIITLDRPRALNALNLAMAQQLDALLAGWATDPAVEAVLIRSASERAFCAGGDVRSIGVLPEPEQRAALGRAFFHAEYSANHRIGTFPKPFIALLGGITMGGGLGLSVLGSHRVVGETLRMAMPETVLGLFPDVGASWFLNRCPGALGRCLALTGLALDAADALVAGLATHHVPVGRFAALTAALATAPALDMAAVDAIVADHGAPIGAGALAGRLATIDQLFAGDDLDAVIDRLAAAAGRAPWIDELYATLRRASPTSLRATWRRMCDAPGQSLQQVLVDDFRMAVRMVAEHDFAEGVRAILVDKDQAPIWSPATLDAVTEQDLDRMLLPLDPADLSLGR